MNEGKEGEEGGRKRERRKRNLKNINFLWVCFFFFPLFIGFGGLCCFILLESLIKGSHHVLTTRYTF